MAAHESAARRESHGGACRSGLRADRGADPLHGGGGHARRGAGHGDRGGKFAADLQLEYRATVELAASPVSIVEIGASLGVPVGVARVLVSDLVNAKYLVVHLPPVPTTTGGGPAPEILERLLHGLRTR